jgi:hypothetical protein
VVVVVVVVVVLLLLLLLLPPPPALDAWNSPENPEACSIDNVRWRCLHYFIQHVPAAHIVR